MNEKNKEFIKKYAARGVSTGVLEILLREAYYSELIRFDPKGNPYWNGRGESLDPNVELDWEE